MRVTVANFLEHFPAFSDIEDTTLISRKLAEAERRVNSCVWGKWYDDGIRYLAAHLLALDPMAQNARLEPAEETQFGLEYKRLQRQVTAGIRIAASQVFPGACAVVTAALQAKQGPMLVFRPQAGGKTVDNVYATWSELYDAYLGTYGPIDISFDDSYTDPIVIPSGVYNFRADTRFMGQARNKTVEVRFEDGAVLQGLTEVRRGLALVSDSSDAIIKNPETFILESSSIKAAGTCSFIVHDNVSFTKAFYLDNGSSVKAGAIEAVDINSFLTIALLGDGQIETDSIRGGASGNVFLTVNTEGESGISRQQANYPNVFPAGYIRLSHAALSVESAVNTLDFNAALGTFHRVDTSGGPVIATLPSAAISTSGGSLTVKDVVGNAGVSAITLAAQGTDTVDGAATAQINVNFGSARVITDGSSGWYII